MVDASPAKSRIETLIEQRDMDGLIRAMDQEPDHLSRVAAVRGLAGLGDARAIPALVNALQSERLRDIRIEIADALAGLGASQAVLPLLKARDVQVRRAAIRALGWRGNSAALEALLLALDDIALRDAALRALGHIGDPSALNIMSEYVQDKASHVRVAAAEALGMLEDPAAESSLLQLLADPDPQVRAAASRSLGALRSEAAVEPLIAMLDVSATRAAVLEALGRIGDLRARDPIAAMLLRRSERTRQYAADALHDMGDPSVGPDLLPLLLDTDYLVRRSAARALGRLAHPGSVDALAAVMHRDKEQIVRWQAARALEAIGSPEALAALAGAEGAGSTEGQAGAEQILVLCSHNSARSIMAEAFLRRYAGDRYEVHSAGLQATGINPYTIRVMEEVGIDLSQAESKSVSGFIGLPAFRFLITVCNVAEENCPTIWPGKVERLYWPFEDPSAARGTDEEIMAVFRRVRDEIDSRVQEWLSVQTMSA